MFRLPRLARFRFLAFFCAWCLCLGAVWAEEAQPKKDADAAKPMKLGGVYGALLSQASASSEGSSTKKAPPGENVSSDLARIEANLGDVQKALTSIKGRLPEQKEEVKGAPFVKTYVSLFVQCLEERSIELQKGLNDLSRHISDLVKWKLSWRLWVETSLVLISFAVTTLLAVLCAVVVHWWLTRFLEGDLLKWTLASLSSRPRLQSVVSFLIYVSAACLPLCVMFVVQISLFFLIEGVTDLKNAMLAFATGLFLWLALWRIQGVVFRYIPLSFFNPGGQKRKKALLFDLQCFLFFWIVNDWIVELFSFFKLSREVSILVMFVFGLGMTISAMAFVHNLKRPILRWIKNTQERQFPLLTTAFWMLWNSFPIILYALFIFDEESFQRFFWPLTLTMLLLPLIPVLYLNFQRLRVWYLMSHRHDDHKSFLFRWLRTKTQANRFFYVFTYGVTGVMAIELWDFRFFYYLKVTLGTNIYDQLADIILLLVGAWLFVHFGDRILRHYLEPKRLPYVTESFYTKGRMRTLLMVSRTALRVTMVITLSLTVLVRLQYNITPIVTNLGLLSVVFSFGLQSFVKDFFAGLLCLLDNNVVVGDWVDIDGKLGIVEELTLRIIRVRADNGTLLTIPFGNIKILGNRSRHFSCVLINLVVPYDEDPERIQKILERAYQNLRQNRIYRSKLAGPIEVRGVNEIRDYALVFQARIKTNPAEQEFVRRGYNRMLKEILDEEEIKVPTPPYPVLRDQLSTTFLPKPQGSV
ncbi:mechanosensitive ion channel family protein [Candidatus Hepatobacter penaei]|uniref:mechanosensitive ion channel family protein n=1 Tax=Candidatus Hepatobacter penaei TaxID=1274402 RepID=UPI0004F3CA3A|nr:mechanosensitive ion channel family protein [Candidatus Hepatobacter penaei]